MNSITEKNQGSEETLLTCIVCPQGCKLRVQKTEGVWQVSGEKCIRGRDYALQELTLPLRNLTTSVLVEKGTQPLAGVRLSEPISREKIGEAMEFLKCIRVEAPVEVGQVIHLNLLGLKVDVVVTRGVPRSKF